MTRKIFYGWWILALGCVINAVGVGLFYNSFTVFFLPLKRDFAVSSAAISLLYGASRLEGGLEGPVVGYLIDRLGPRALIFIGSTMAGVGLILLTTVHSYWSFFFIYIFIVSLGNNAGFFHPTTTAVNSWFVRRRGIAFSCISASANVGGMIMAPLLSYIILYFGWRMGAITAGLIILAVALPAGRYIYRSPEDLGLYPDGEPPRDHLPLPNPSPSNGKSDTEFTVRAALKTASYWILMAALSLRLFATVALNTHFIPILVWRGMDEMTGAFLVSLFAFSTILTCLAMGWMGDRWEKTFLCSLGIIPTIVSMIGLIFSQATPLLYFFPIAMAITMGTAPLNWALIGDFFGRKSYATLRGILGVGYGLATFISPIYLGWIFDLTGSYTYGLVTLIIILAIPTLLFAFLRPPSPPAKT
jgi:sugar phosphate permease